MNRQESNYIVMRLQEDLRREIRTCRLRGGTQLNAESQLSKHYGICRGGVRKALSQLEQEGLIYKVRGSGTFVTASTNTINPSGPPVQPAPEQVLFLTFDNAMSQSTLNAPHTYAPIINGVNRFLLKHAYNLNFGHVTPGLPLPFMLRDGAISRVLLMGWSEEEEYGAILKHLPCVGIHDFHYPQEISWVGTNELQRNLIAVEHLLALGHRRIGFLSDECEEPGPRRRFEGYVTAMREFGLPMRPEWHIQWQRPRINGELRPERSPDYSDKLAPVFQAREAPTALICFDNSRALFTLYALQKIGLRIPEDVSLFGGYLATPDFTSPVRFTGCNERLDDICAEAARLLFSDINDGLPVSGKVVLITPTLEVGVSTAPCRLQENAKKGQI